jgi:hypothetical protein
MVQHHIRVQNPRYTRWKVKGFLKNEKKIEKNKIKKSCFLRYRKNRKLYVFLHFFQNAIIIVKCVKSIMTYRTISCFLTEKKS